MNIKIIKPTVADGEARKVGAELEVSEKEGKDLVRMGRAENLEEEVTAELSLNIEISEEQLAEIKKNLTEKFEEKIKELEANNAELLNDADEVLREKIAHREAEYATLYADVFSMSFKDLKAKYSSSKEE